MFSGSSLSKATLQCLLLISVAPATSAPEIDLARLPLHLCLANELHKPLGSEQSGLLHVGPMTIDDRSDIYQTDFDSASWSGSLRKYKTSLNQDNGITMTEQVLWDAGVILDNMEPAQRAIFTFNPATHSTVPFKFDQLSGEMQSLFDESPDNGALDNAGAQRVNYLRGERTLEASGGKFRVRKSILGDIVNSAPVFAGGAAKNISEKNYPAFFNQFQHRPGTIYVGANDGMLHAFSAESGKELFAYIPGSLLNKLPALTTPAYRHDAYMDGNIRVSEAQLSHTWKTVLAAGMGSGSKGVFALDVTAPQAFMNGQGVLFEFTEQDDADIGFVTSAPVIAKIMTEKNSDGSAAYQYFVMVGSGFNSFNPNGDGFLFLLSLDKAAANKWELNKNYYKIRAANLNAGAGNALSAPGLVLNAQGAALYAYAGDLQGNLWRFDFSSGGNPGSIAAVNIFNAVDSNNLAQPITTAPVIAYAPGGGHVVLFGTGKYVEQADLRAADFRLNSFYAIHDSAADHHTVRIKKNELASRNVIGSALNGTSGYRIAGADFVYGGQTASAKKGWYLDLPDSNLTGERVINEAAAEFGQVFFNTFTPDAVPCRSAGSSTSYKLDLLTGKTAGTDAITGFKSSHGPLGTPTVVLTHSEPGARNSFGQRDTTQYYSVINFNSGADGAQAGIVNSDQAVVKAGRLSWIEIQNWRSLKK